MCAGFCSVLSMVPSFSKSHAYDAALVEASVKLTVSGTAPESGSPLNCATGAGSLTVIKAISVFVSEPAALVTVRLTL